MKCFIKKSFLIISELCILNSALSVYACPLCKDIIAKTGLAKGFYWSILLMLAVPAFVVAVIAGIITRTYRRRDASSP
jgi:hypothetical protein